MNPRSRGAVDWGELGALCLLGLIALAWLFDWDPLSSTVTIYPLVCSMAFRGVHCHGDLHTLTTIIYKAIERRQEVLLLRGDGTPPQRLTRCVVWDDETWKCDGPPDMSNGLTFEEARTPGLIDFEQTTMMRDGQLRSSEKVVAAPKWRWWITRLREALPGWLARLREIRNRWNSAISGILG